ncbi:hypothetical protein C5167_010961 [Papaver somniferum]|uniref:BRI1 kinase inhibitor 1 n=1 Tax=Papaver somniferum TaxID=3469 RepID=A0A4Y7K5T3_PAPSO|nr:BRI1 kinase inhibitor 1-like [Papaver somniferum]RZC67279.1 hypothetical protein C5167_010961 [Papaver somniferum]
METQPGKMKQEEQQSTKLIEPNSTTTTTTTTSSPSSSPTHEFSFTISVQPTNKLSSSSPYAIDLSPADEIFFHGHLLPLHFLSHFPMSPRRSTANSVDCSTTTSQPIKDVLEDKKTMNSKQFNRSNSFRTKRRIKVKSFSLFRPMKWRKPCEADEGGEDGEENEETAMKKKVRFDAGIILKSYLRMVRPLLFFRGLSSKNCKLQTRPHSFSSSYPNPKARKEDRDGRNSAPASFQTSNTSPLQARDRFPTSVKDGSMDELQSAIEAAIAHCKNSSTTQEGKFKFQC